MAFQRRTFLLTAGAGLALVGCMGDAPTVLSIRAQGGTGMNPGPDGADRPVTLNILQMSGTGAFDAADYFALQSLSSALGAELVKADQLVLAPGGTAATAITVQPGTSAIGVTAGFRDPAGRTVRQRIAVPASSSGVIISVGASGISVATA